MAAPGIQLRVVDQDVLETLERIERLAERPTAIMSAISSFLVSAVQTHFQNEMGPDGKWQRLSPRTARKKRGRKERGTANILRVSGRLYSSITGEATDTTAAVGTNVAYAAAQFLGATIQKPARGQDINFAPGKGRRRFVSASRKRRETVRVTIGAHTITIPARQALYVNDADRAEILQIAEDAIREEAGQP